MKYKFEKEGIYNIYITEKEKISGMSWMFYECNSLKSIDLPNFNTNNVTDMYKMFLNIPKNCKIKSKDKKIYYVHFFKMRLKINIIYLQTI